MKNKYLYILTFTACVLAPNIVGAYDTTDMGEIDVVLAPDNNQTYEHALEHQENVRLDMPELAKPVHLRVLNHTQNIVTEFTTQKPITYLRLPSGVYYIDMQKGAERQIIKIEAKDDIMQQYDL